MTILRPYQLAAIDRARHAMRRGKRRVLITVPTGGGKTIIATEGIIKPAVAKGGRVLFIAHRRELIEQCSRKLDMPHGIIMGAGACDYSIPVQVASVQTLARRDLPQATVIIWDEAHHCVASTYAAIAARYPDAVHIGLTATPTLLSGRGLRECFDDLIVVTDVASLIRDGFLVPPIVYAPPPPDLDAIATRGGDYAIGQLGVAMNRAKLVGDVVAHWRKHASDRITVCFATSIEHSEHLTGRFQAAGVAAEHLDASSSDRSDVLARLASGETRVVSNCGILTEGWDLPQCGCVIMARPTKSRGLYKQMAGRALRPHPGKTDCIILDHAGNTYEHGLITDPDDVSLDGVRAQKRDGEQAPTVRMCPQCYAANPASVDICQQCATPFPTKPRVITEAEAGELVAVKAALMPTASVDLKRRKLAELRATAAAKNYKQGWASYRFKSIFGHWPTPSLEPEAVS